MTVKINDKPKSENLRSAWKKRNDYHNMTGTPIHNTWRSIRFTLKGKKAGCCDEWGDFTAFYVDMEDSYFDGSLLRRLDRTKPYSKDNCKWATPEELANSQKNTIRIKYNGKEQTMREWSNELGVTYMGIKLRHARYPELPTEELLFGKKRRVKPVITDINLLTKQKQKDKVSKMISAYRCKDKKRGRVFGLTNDWVLENIIKKPCVYCGDTENVGCDRVDNKKGHTNDNVVPCCASCNTTRGDNFTHFEMLELGDTIKQIKHKRNISKQ